MYSGSPRSPPVRRQSSAIEHIPFSTSLSHLSVELGKTDSTASSPCRSELSSSGLSFRDHEQQKKSLEEENFKLKLRVYMLEERVQRQDSPDRSNKVVAELRVQAAALREELTQKSALLRRASDTLEVLEQRQSEQQALLRRGQADRALLEDSLQELEAQCRAEQEQRRAAEAEQERLEDLVQQRCRQAQREAQRAAAALASLEQRHAQEASGREAAERDRDRLQEELRRLDRRHAEERRSREAALEDNAQLRRLLNNRRRHEADDPTASSPNKKESRAQNGAPGLLSPPPVAGAGAAAASERRREQAVAAAALQLQTERARSLQASVQSLAEQVRRAQAELAQCRAERDQLLQHQQLQQQQQQQPARGAALSEPAPSSTEGVEVIQETPPAGPPQGHQSSCLDLAAWLGSNADLQSQSDDEPPPPLVRPQPPADRRGPQQTQAGGTSGAPPPLVSAAPGDASDWDTWSEPDRSVSRARIGLDRSSLEPPAQHWRNSEATTDTEARTGHHRSQRRTSAEEHELESRIEGLQQIRDGLWTEVALYQKLVTAAGGTTEPQGVTVPPELLADVQRLHQRMQDAVTDTGLLGRRRQRGADSWTAPPELALALTITQEELAESSQKLTAAQERSQKLRTRLQQARDRLRQTEQERDQLHQRCDQASEETARLRQRLEQTEADRDLLAETVRRQSEQPAAGALRRTRHQLERSAQRQEELEQLVRQLTEQLRQLPGGGGGSAAAVAAAEAEQRARRAESQLLALGRQRLRLQTELTRMRSRARLLRSEESVRDSQQAETAAAAAAAAQRQQRQQRLRPAGDTGDTADRHALRELTQRLERAHAEIDTMRAKAQEYDETGHSCPESGRSCDLPVAPSSPGGPRLSSHSESDPLEPLRASRGPPAYSSPDLGIESDCQRSSSRTSTTTVQSQRSGDAGHLTPLPSGKEAAPPAGARAAATGDLSALTATRTALQQALQRLGRAEHSKAAVQSAIYRGIGETQLLVSRARGSLLRPGAEGAPPSER